MPSKQPKQQKQIKKTNWREPKVEVLLLAIVIGLGVVWFVGSKVYTNVRVRQDKQLFAELEQNLDKVAGILEKDSGVKLVKRKGCAADTVKFGGGKLRCSIEYRTAPGGKIPTARATDSLIRNNTPFNPGSGNEQYLYYSYHKGSGCSVRQDIDQTYLEFRCSNGVYQQVYN